MKKGFTLIELMMVISIIAVLSVIAIGVYTRFLQNSRDAKRQGDLSTLQSALEQYFADQLYYPCNGITGGAAFTSSTGNCSATAPPNLKTYISAIPSESVSTRSPYVYQAFATSAGGSCDNAATRCTFYCFHVSMENTSKTAVGCTSPAANPTPYNFAVTLP